MHCHKGISPAKIYKNLKGIISCFGVYKAVKRLRMTGSFLSKDTPERSVRIKNLL